MKKNIYTGKKTSSNKKFTKREPSSQSKTKNVQCLFCLMRGHEKVWCHFKLKAMQDAQNKTKNKVQPKNSQETSNEALAVEQEMSDFSDASNNLNPIP